LLSLYALSHVVSSYPALNENKSLIPEESESPAALSQSNHKPHPDSHGNPFAKIISRLNEKIKEANSGISFSNIVLFI